MLLLRGRWSPGIKGQFYRCDDIHIGRDEDMLDLTQELNKFMTILYGHEPKMNKTWQQLYTDEFTHITKDLFRFHVSSVRASVPCDQTHIMTFIVYEEKTYMNNAKFVHQLTQEQAMQLLPLSAQIRTKIQTEYNLRLAEKRAAKSS